MIVIGYPGVGKSTVSKKNTKCVDFDSSMFPKEDGWEELYVQRAESLSNQGFIVFVSAHKKVQDLLLESKEEVSVIYPSLRLHDFWIQKLKDRYEEHGSEENKRALYRCVSHYCEDILELEALPFKKTVIDKEDYDLTELFNNNNSNVTTE